MSEDWKNGLLVRPMDDGEMVNCDNLFIITKFQGDPELGGGYLERNMYSVKRAPSTRTIMGGLSLTL